jgi:hypothetical protein
MCAAGSRMILVFTNAWLGPIVQRPQTRRIVPMAIDLKGLNHTQLGDLI